MECSSKCYTPFYFYIFRDIIESSVSKDYIVITLEGKAEVESA